MDRRQFLGAAIALNAAAAAPHPFAAIAVRWPDDAPPVVRFRASPDGLRWTAWRAIGPDPHSGRTALIIFEENCRYLETDSGRTLDVRFIDPGPDPLIPKTRAPEDDDPTTRPRIVSRIEWGSPDGDRMRGTPIYTNVTHLIVHHTADGPLANYAAWVRAIWNFHVFTNRWDDIGYNYLIAPDGTIFEGRAGGDNVVGAHFSCQNGGTLGVALLGDYTRVAPPAAALDSLARLLAWRANALRLNVLGTNIHFGTRLDMPIISSHRDGNPSPQACTRTECPGNMFYPLLGRLRNEVFSLLTGTLLWSPSPGAPWTAEEGGIWRADKAEGFLESTPLAYQWPVRLDFESFTSASATRRLVEISVNNGEWNALAEVAHNADAWTPQSIAVPLTEGKFRLRFRLETTEAPAAWRVRNLQVVPNVE